MHGTVDLLATTKFCLIVILFKLTEVIYGLECDTNFNFSFRQLSFCFGKCSVDYSKTIGIIRAQSLNEFDAICKKPKLIHSSMHASQYYYSSKAVFGQNSALSHKAFIFDFNLITGEVYIDFTKLNQTFIQQVKPQANVSLIITLVARQFVTFRIFNLPSTKSVYINDIKIMLSGSASLELMERKGDLAVQVYHSPLYRYSSDRREWINYLNTLLGVSKNGYIEYLSEFCQISHIRIDLNKIILNLHNTSTFEDFVEPLEEMESLYENIESELSQYRLGRLCSLSVNELLFLDSFEKKKKYFAINSEPHIFLHIGLNKDKNENYLKIFFKECDIGKVYNLILFVDKDFDTESKVERSKKLIIDENYCHLRIYANTEVYNLVGDERQYTRFDYIASDRTESKPDFREQIFELLDKQQVNSFLYMKVLPRATETELRFFTERDEYYADKFYNLINQQIFLEKQVGSKDQIESYTDDNFNNYSVKFAVRESDVREYFHSKDINLLAYLEFNQIKSQTIDGYDFVDKTDQMEYFWISDKRCKAIILDSEIFPGNYPYLLFFNSNLYTNQANCYYFDNSTNIFHMILGFNFNYENYTKTIFFNMQKSHLQIDEFNYLSKHLEDLQEKAIKNYYKNVLLKGIESSYQVDTEGKITAPKNNENSYQVTSTIRFRSLDDAVSWSPEFCWLSQLECTNHVDSLFFSKDLVQNHIYDYEEFEPPKGLDHMPDFVPNMPRQRRSFYSNSQTDLVYHTILNFSTEIQKIQTKRYFLHEIKLKLKLEKTPKNFKFILCNLKPFASCSEPNGNYSKEKSQLYQACEETKIKKFLQENSLDPRLTKTVFLSKFDSNGNLFELVSYNSNKAKHANTRCSKLIPKNGLHDSHLTTIPTLSRKKSTSNLIHTENFYKSVMLFINMNKLTAILIFVSLAASVFLVILVRLICKKSYRASNGCEFNAHLSKRNMELKPLNSSTKEYTNGENIDHKLKLLNEKNKFKKKGLKKKRFDLNNTITEV